MKPTLVAILYNSMLRADLCVLDRALDNNYATPFFLGKNLLYIIH